MPYVTNDANAVLNLFKDGKIATAPLNAETLDDALEHRWKINRFNDGSRLLHRVQPSARPHHGEPESASRVVARVRSG